MRAAGSAPDPQFVALAPLSPTLSPRKGGWRGGRAASVFSSFALACRPGAPRRGRPGVGHLPAIVRAQIVRPGGRERFEVGSTSASWRVGIRRGAPTTGSG